MHRAVMLISTIVLAVTAPPLVVVEAIAVFGKTITVLPDVRAVWIAVITVAAITAIHALLIRQAQGDTAERIRQAVAEAVAEAVADLVAELRETVHAEMTAHAEADAAARRRTLHLFTQEIRTVLEEVVNEPISLGLGKAVRYGMVTAAAAMANTRRDSDTEPVNRKRNGEVVRIRQRQGE